MKSTLQAAIVTMVTLTACAYHNVDIVGAPEAAWLPTAATTVVGQSASATLQLMPTRFANATNVTTRVTANGVDAQLQQIDAASDANGYVRVNVSTTHAGIVSLSASVVVKGITLDTGATLPLTFVASTPQALTLTCTNCAGSDAAPRQTELQVAAVDMYGNPTGSYTGEVTLSNNEGPASQANISVRFDSADQGVQTASMTFTTANAVGWTISAYDVSNAQFSAVLAGITVSAGAVAEVTLDPYYSPYDACSWTYYAVKLADAYGNNANNYTGDVILSGQPDFLGDHNSMVDPDLGYASFEISFPGPGAYQMTATVQGLSQTGVTAAAAVSPNFILSDPVVQDDTGCVPIRYRIDYACAAEVRVSFDLPSTGLTDAASGSATLSPDSIYGVHGVNFTQDLEFLWDATHDAPMGVGNANLTIQVSTAEFESVPAQVIPVKLSYGLTFSDTASSTVLSMVAAAYYVDPTFGQGYLLGTDGSKVTIQAMENGGVQQSTFVGSGLGIFSSLAVGQLSNNANSTALACMNGNQIYSWAIAANGNISPIATASPNIHCGRMIVVDLNNDNLDDIVTSDGNVLVAAYNNGASPPGFNANTVILSPAHVYGFGVADINRDGVKDIVSLVQILGGTYLANSLNANGSTSYSGTTFATSISPSTGAYSSMALGDVDRDGYIDVAVGNGANEVFYMGSSNPNAFTISTAYSAAAEGNIVALIDMNHDGKLDVVTQGVGNAGVALRAQNGNFLASPLYTSTVSNKVVSTFVYDVARDAYPDVLTLTSNQLITHANTVPPLCSHRVEGPHFTPIDPNSHVAVSGDFNEDGKRDVAYVGANAISFSAGSGADTLLMASQSSAIPTTSLTGVPAAVGDVNGDGHLDILLPAINATHTLNIYSGDGNGMFSYFQGVALNANATDYSGVVLTDANGDGYLDALVAETTAVDFNTGAVSLVLGGRSGMGSVAVRMAVGNGSPLHRIFSGTNAGFDLNGDGLFDMLTFSPNDVTPIKAWLASGAPEYTLTSQLGSSGQFASVGVGDVTGDGNDDVLGVTANQNMMLASGRGGGVFNGLQQAGTLGAPCSPKRTVVAQLDIFSGEDVAILCGPEGHVAVAYSSGASGSLRSVVNVPVDPNSGHLELGDFDTDGFEDLLINAGRVGSVIAQNLWAYGRFSGGDFNDTYTTGSNQNSRNGALVLADTDRNATLDAVFFAQQSVGAELVMNLNDGTGDFDGTTRSNYSAGPGTYLLAVADVDRDGQLDYATAENQTITIVYDRLGTQNVATAGTISGLFFADNNADGWKDLVVLEEGVLSIYDNSAGPVPFTTSHVALTPTAPVNAVLVADIVPNGADQILCDSYTSVVSVGPLSSDVVLFSVPAGNILALAAVDMNQDGLNDVVVEYVNDGNLTVGVYINGPPAGKFGTSASWSYATASLATPGMLALGDFDGDTFNDIAFSAFPSAVTIVSPSTNTLTHLAETVGYVGLVAADLNRDGFTDVGTLTSENPTFAVPLTHTVGTFFGH